MNISVTAKTFFVFILYFGKGYYVSSCCVNITVAVLNEYSKSIDFPTQINRTAGIIDRALNKSREILQDVANVEFIIYNLDYPACTSLHWGALTARMYFFENIHAIIGPGNFHFFYFSLQTFLYFERKWNMDDGRDHVKAT